MNRDAGDSSCHFLLAATAYGFGDERGAETISGLAASLSLPWISRLRENAAYHELEPLLSLVAADCSALGRPLGLPRDLLARWEEARTRETARAAVIQYGAVRALGALDRAGVRAVPLKGFYLASRYYERKSARAFKDLDLLVEREALGDLDRVLRESGFQPAPGRPSFVPAPAHTVYSLAVGDGDTAMEIDIHVGMHWPGEYERRTGFRPSDLWSAASREVVEDMRLWALSKEHLLVTTLLDVAVNHRYARLSKFRDVIEVLRATGVDWDEVADCCRRWRVRSFVGPGLRFAKEMDESLAIPANVPGSVLPSYAAMKAFLRALPPKALPDHRSRSFSPANLLFFLLADSAGERARGLLHMPGHIFRGRRRF